MMYDDDDGDDSDDVDDDDNAQGPLKDYFKEIEEIRDNCEKVNRIVKSSRTPFIRYDDNDD